MIFDEKRVFASGPMPGPFAIRGVRIGVPICEDIWGTDPVECLSETGAEILLVPNGSPFDALKRDTQKLKPAVDAATANAEAARVAATELSERSAASETDRASALAHQGNIEALLSRLVEENIHGRSALAEDLGNVLARMPDRAKQVRAARLRARFGGR